MYQIFDHGEMPLDNNHDEQQIRPTTIGRKNYLFTKSEVGAKANAMWYSIIQTAKLNKLRVREYLEYLLEAFAWTDQPIGKPICHGHQKFRKDFASPIEKKLAEISFFRISQRAFDKDGLLCRVYF